MRESSVNRHRLRSTIEELGAIGLDPSGGRTRLALDDHEREGRDTLVRWMRDAGLEVKVDPIGNISASSQERSRGIRSPWGPT